MTDPREDMLAILRHNLGFRSLEQWVDYGLGHSFARVDAMPVSVCPDCGSPPSGELGQYVYYSNLIHLMTCPECHLIFADAHLDPRVVSTHFDTAYKDRLYFNDARALIFRHLIAEIDRRAPHGGSVLDIGGAQGDLMHLLAQRRPDLTGTVHDLSPKAVLHAQKYFGLQAFCGGIEELESLNMRFDVVVLSDVLYYEPNIADFWRVLPRLLAPDGSVIIRVPNKLLLIRVAHAMSRFGRLLGSRRIQDRVKYFNSEHIYIMSRWYLTNRLRKLGFATIDALPSPPLMASPSRALELAFRGLIRGASLLARASQGRIILTPGLVVTGTLPAGGTTNLRGT